MDDIDLTHWTFKSLQPELYSRVRANKTLEQAKRMCTFTPVHKTSGFSLYEDVPRKRGWIASANATAAESITFELPLVPVSHLGKSSYSVWIGFLRSYRQMGKFTVHLSPGTNSTAVTLDGLWSRPRSTAEEANAGKCVGPTNVTITTVPEREGSNKVKVLWIRVVAV
mmetsp:Transcript_25101/g.75617  ORF Transcript_25101/g.75617 Transcript_25101/m.75617 type:complete len:168 (-) Transcript_25101:145-648(-)|eukprot:CAMPEP_0206300876 /NCGR_PEP_ID=MMETSP0106_2-20121207/7928_1 /ASSEMBLY_ACC=CAM_ASM_000206 /TAXON_ID=81532 /ORGANISM="Acanthoeca-like sp., Strain 10tr" /LENGTH=167 /DNA_ID=CAMNT_0053731615 /DNA_START=316 /DNA_END=819 /DNA_ORIENTATION=-